MLVLNTQAYLCSKNTQTVPSTLVKGNSGGEPLKNEKDKATTGIFIGKWGYTNSLVGAQEGCYGAKCNAA